MKFTSAAVTVAGLVVSAQAHATFQYFWTDASTSTNTCVRQPTNNNPIGSTASTIACNSGGDTPAATVCTVSAGSTASFEMHQQPGDRTCATEAIGGNHDGPTIIYMAKVSDAKSAIGSSAGWFKVAQTGLVTANPTSQTYTWGTDVMNSNCGKVTFTVPSDIAPGDYLVRAEVIALHVAGSSGGAQHYASCAQVKVTGGGNASPSTVKFPGAYSLSDPGILFNIYSSYTTYPVPGPTVYGGGGAPIGTITTTATTIKPTTTVTPTTTASGPAQTAYGQCGGIGWTGPTTCVSGYTCKKSGDYYSQCLA